MSLAVVTPTHRNDLQIFTDLHQSVLLHTEECVKHYVIVPEADVGLFARMVGPRCIIVPEESQYSPHYRSMRAVNNVLRPLPCIPSHARIAALNVKRPFTPIRGWVMQQALKMELSRQLDVDTILLIDSDVELVRPVDELMLRRGGRAMLYRRPDAVDIRLPRHMQWHTVARRLLGLPPARFPAPDYVTSFCVWEPGVIRALIAQIEQVTGRSWMDAITGQRTFSEWTLYGVFAEEMMKYEKEALTESSLCHSYWGTVPLTIEGAGEFLSGINPEDVAILIQSKTQTPRTVRRAVMGAFRP